MRTTLLSLAAVVAARTGPVVPAGFVAKHNALAAEGASNWIASDEAAARFQGLTLAQVSKMLGSRRASSPSPHLRCWPRDRHVAGWRRHPVSSHEPQQRLVHEEQSLGRQC